MSREITFAHWRTVHWEKPTDKGIRYYAVRIHQDLWGGWVLTKTWGRRGTRLGRVVHTPCGSYQTALEELARVHARREQRGYKVNSI